jgi:hypothetical protein
MSVTQSPDPQSSPYMRQPFIVPTHVEHLPLPASRFYHIIHIDVFLQVHLGPLTYIVAGEIFNFRQRELIF